MRTTQYTSALIFLMITAMSEHSHGAEDARAKLSMFEGEWTVKGSESTYRETCAWLPGASFLACNAEDKSTSGSNYSHSILGFSTAESIYTYALFHGAGSSRTLRGSLENGVWKFFGQTDRAPAWRRYQVTITPTSEGFHFLEEVSDRGWPWNTNEQIEYLRLK